MLMTWDMLPKDVINLILTHRLKLMATSILDKEISIQNKMFDGQRLKRIRWAHRFSSPNQKYDKIIEQLFSEHDIWVHYYAS